MPASTSIFAFRAGKATVTAGVNLHDPTTYESVVTESTGPLTIRLQK